MKDNKHICKKIILFILIIVFSCCGPRSDSPAETNSTSQPDSGVGYTQKYTVQKWEGSSDQITDTVVNIGKEHNKITIKNYLKGDYVISDTSGDQVFLFKENFIDISINSKTITIDKSMFKGVYTDKNMLYHSGFGNTIIEKIDPERNKIIFKTFFGYHNSDNGEILIYSLTLDGSFEYIGTEAPRFGEDDM